MALLFWLAIIILFLIIAISLEIALGMRRMTDIKDVLPIQHENVPRVSFIIPACNETNTIETALQSVLELDYANLEIIVVNDRSTDNTEAVLERMKSKYPNLILHKISELPRDWMGKSYALQSGAERAQGEYFLEALRRMKSACFKLSSNFCRSMVRIRTRNRRESFTSYGHL